MDTKIKPLCFNFTKWKVKKRTYSLEFKLKAVELSNERGSLISVANELNVIVQIILNVGRKSLIKVN